MATRTNYGERMARVEEKVDGLRDDIREIKKLLNEGNNKFAAKWVEKFTAGLIVFVLTTVLGALLTIVVRPML